MFDFTSSYADSYEFLLMKHTLLSIVATPWGYWSELKFNQFSSIYTDVWISYMLDISFRHVSFIYERSWLLIIVATGFLSQL